MNTSGAMVTGTLVNGIKVTSTVTGPSHGMMNGFMLDNGKIIKFMESAPTTGKTVACTLASTKLTSNKVKVSTCGLMVLLIKVNGKTEKKTASAFTWRKARKTHQMASRSEKEYGKTANVRNG